MTVGETPVKASLSWGVEALPEQRRYAELVREVTSLVLTLEQADPALLALLQALDLARTDLADRIPASSTPRIGQHVEGDGRVYLDHCRDIGAFNPMFPVYEITVAGPERAYGAVRFPVAYEGPAGGVNGGFLAVFFDEVVQHHNCDLGISGATRDFDISYRRQVPLLTDLRFEITREVGARAVFSDVRLLLGDDLLCSATTNAALFNGQSPAVADRRPR